MERKRPARLGAQRLIASCFGVLSGLGGLTHGVGEVLQGSVRPNGVLINSWTVGPIATNMGGEPAMTIIPNLLVTGVLTILVSSALVVWSAAFVRSRRDGAIQVLLAVASLLVGAGFGPPIMGILSGLAGRGIGAPHTWWRTRVPTRLRGAIARAWPWIFAVTLANGVFLVVGSLILVWGFGLNMPDLFVYSFFFAVVSLLLTIPAGIAYDIQGEQAPQARWGGHRRVAEQADRAGG